MEIFDSHAHYDDPAFDPDRDALLARLPAAGVAGLINAGTTAESSLKSVRLAEKYPFVYAAAGIHPQEVMTSSPSDLQKIGELAGRKKVVAIGEIGLDYHYAIDRQAQLKLFEAQLALAHELKLPVIVHDRQAHADTLALLKKFRPRGVLHCFSGSAEMAAEAVRLDLYIGFTGVVTFKNNKKVASVVAAVPDELLLCETDCPYMAPEPLRGKRCDSSMLPHTIARLASVRGMAPEDLAALTACNARRLFGII